MISSQKKSCEIIGKGIENELQETERNEIKSQEVSSERKVFSIGRFTSDRHDMMRCI